MEYTVPSGANISCAACLKTSQIMAAEVEISEMC